jgi:hypothetical protein
MVVMLATTAQYREGLFFNMNMLQNELRIEEETNHHHHHLLRVALSRCLQNT